MSEMRPRSLAAQWITAVAFVGCLVVGLWFILKPCSYRGEGTTLQGEVLPPNSCAGSVLDHEGPGVFLILAIPLLFVATAFIAARFAQPIVLWVMSGTLLLFSVLAVFSFGVFTLPVAFLLLVAAGFSTVAWDRARWAARAEAARE